MSNNYKLQNSNIKSNKTTNFPIVKIKWKFSASKILIILFVIFLIVFPKGGIKLNGIPLTFGYMLLGLVSLGVFIVNLATGWALRISRQRLIVIFTMLSFQVIAIGTILSNGFLERGYAIALFTNLIFIPNAFIYIIAPQIERLDIEFLLRLIKRAVFIISIFGLILFLYKLTTGLYIEIPYLTINSDDVGLLDEKDNDRGGVFKLISTYNNGNIYGVALLILLPLYCYLEQSFLKKFVVKFTLILTLSRTVWIGLMLYEILFFRNLPKARKLYSFIGIVLLVSLVFGSMIFMKKDMDFLFDSTLGGRAEQLDITIEVFSSKAFVAITEIVPASILAQFGVSGLVTFFLGMISPLLIWLMGYLPHSRTGYKRNLAMGLLIYCVVMFSDGAINNIPVMVFYWFVASLLLSHNMPVQSSSPLK